MGAALRLFTIRSQGFGCNYLNSLVVKYLLSLRLQLNIFKLAKIIKLQAHYTKGTKPVLTLIKLLFKNKFYLFALRLRFLFHLSLAVLHFTIAHNNLFKLRRWLSFFSNNALNLSFYLSLLYFFFNKTGF